MNGRLPIEMDNLELPKDQFKKLDRKNSYGFANTLYILAMIITIGSVLTVIFLGNR